MESTLIWHKPTDPVPAGVELILIYKNHDIYDIVNYTFKSSREIKIFASYPVIAWAECNVRITAEMMMGNFDIQWIDFLHKNATK